MSIYVKFVFVVAAVVSIAEAGAWAAKMPSQSNVVSVSSADSRNSGRQEMLADIALHYVRDTKPDGGTNTAARFSIGGMFNDWIGLDGQGLFEVRDKNYLIGGDVRVAPVEWFFLKGGIGAYSSKQTRTLSLAPLAGAGILARMTRETYFVAESSYFSANGRDNLSFGVGLGLSF